MDTNLPPLMPDEDKNFRGSLVLDFRKWWRHVKTIYYEATTGNTSASAGYIISKLKQNSWWETK